MIGHNSYLSCCSTFTFIRCGALYWHWCSQTYEITTCWARCSTFSWVRNKSHHESAQRIYTHLPACRTRAHSRAALFPTDNQTLCGFAAESRYGTVQLLFVCIVSLTTPSCCVTLVWLQYQLHPRFPCTQVDRHTCKKHCVLMLITTVGFLIVIGHWYRFVMYGSAFLLMFITRYVAVELFFKAVLNVKGSKKSAWTRIYIYLPFLPWKFPFFFLLCSIDEYI